MLGRFFPIALVATQLVTSSSRAEQPRPFYRQSAQEAARTLATLHREQKDFRQRLIAISARFVGTPYHNSPLGEGESGKIDRDPLFRLERVDCLTFIETVIALAHGPTLEGARRAMRLLRYRDGRISFATRHHFPTSQWLPQNERLGLLRDVTREIAGRATVVVRQRLDARLWRRWPSWPKRLGAELPRGTFLLPVLPVRVALRRIGRLPNGALLSIVRKPARGQPDPITHQGLVIVKKGRRYVRHAPSLGNTPHVVDYPLRSYLRRVRAWLAHSKRPFYGVNVQLLLESPRLRAAGSTSPTQNPSSAPRQAPRAGAPSPASR